MRLDIPTARVFHPLLADARYKGARGGRGSGKSHFFGDSVVDYAMAQPGFRMVCIREVQRSLDQSVKRLIQDKIEHHKVRSYFDVQESKIRTPGDGLIIFWGMQNHTGDTIKSLEGFDVAWFEEAQKASQRSLDLLTPTMRKADAELWFSWNPLDPTDPIERFFFGKEPPPDSVTVKANWYDNPWFPVELRREMLWMRRNDPDKYAHVWGGEYRKHSEARVFRNWRVDEFDTPPDARLFFGADWGFARDPSCLIRCWVRGRTLYIDHEAWAIGCEIDRLPALFAGDSPAIPGRQRYWENPRKYPGVPGALQWPIRADSARPETISYMKRKGFRISPAIKGKGSIEDGVEFLKSFDIVIHPRCTHVIDEFAGFSYKVDRHTEEVLPVLEDKKNHTIDAARYALESARRAPTISGIAGDDEESYWRV